MCPGLHCCLVGRHATQAGGLRPAAGCTCQRARRAVARVLRFVVSGLHAAHMRRLQLHPRPALQQRRRGTSAGYVCRACRADPLVSEANVFAGHAAQLVGSVSTCRQQRCQADTWHTTASRHGAVVVRTQVAAANGGAALGQPRLVKGSGDAEPRIHSWSSGHVEHPCCPVSFLYFPAGHCTQSAEMSRDVIIAVFVRHVE